MSGSPGRGVASLSEHRSCQPMSSSFAQWFRTCEFVFTLRRDPQVNESFNPDWSKHRTDSTDRSIGVPREAILAELTFQRWPRDAQDLASLAPMSARQRPHANDVAALHL